MQSPTPAPFPTSKFQRHFFVCHNQRPPTGKPSCGARGSGEILMALQEALAENPTLWDSVTITACGCLGPCHDGPTMVVYPEAVWYAGITKDNLQQIITEHLISGRPVPHLFFNWSTT